MTTPSDSSIPQQSRPSPARPRPPVEEVSVGELIGEVAQDLSRLVRQELDLAKAEIREETGKAGRAAGVLGAAAVAGHLALLVLSFALVFALDDVLGLGWAALLVGAAWAVVALLLLLIGRSRMRQVSPKPERTIESLKEDAQWARHPTR
ncbi:MAG TPA: phage holin family protein [Pseudonocardiaceae bacterium]